MTRRGARRSTEPAPPGTPSARVTAVSLAGLAGAPAPERTPDEAADDGRRRDLALEALGDVWDPELGLDVVTMGLVYDVRVVGGGVEVDMTLTTPGCPVSESLPEEAAAAVRAALPDAAVTVQVVWDPPWTPERLSPEALAALGFTP